VQVQATQTTSASDRSPPTSPVTPEHPFQTTRFVASISVDIALQNNFVILIAPRTQKLIKIRRKLIIKAMLYSM
jgi:hypothetical protein